MDGELWFGFGPNLSHGGWPYVHLEVDMEIVTMVGDI